MQISDKGSARSSFSKETSSKAGYASDSSYTIPLGTRLPPGSFRKLTNLFSSTRSQAFAAAAFLVAVPVFVQAPLVRLVPQASLAMTAIWLFLGWKLLQKYTTQLWGDLIIGFSWTWLAGAVYWGWFRWDPYVHLPIEALGLPVGTDPIALRQSENWQLLLFGLAARHRDYRSVLLLCRANPLLASADGGTARASRYYLAQRPTTNGNLPRRRLRHRAFIPADNVGYYTPKIAQCSVVGLQRRGAKYYPS